MPFNKPSNVPITELMVVFTTRCNLRCPDCLFAFWHDPAYPRDTTVHELWIIAEHFKGIDCLHLTGGEPTTHPLWDRIVPWIRGTFDCKKLAISTNGYGAKRNIGMYKFFDNIYVSHYKSGFYEGYRGNTDEIERIKKEYGERVQVSDFVPGSHLSPDKEFKSHAMCQRGKVGSILYHATRIYPCCAGPARTHTPIPSVPIGPNWKEQLYRLELPCKDCFIGATG